MDKKAVMFVVLGATIILAGIAVFVALRLNQEGTKSIAPTAPESKPKAQEIATCQATLAGIPVNPQPNTNFNIDATINSTTPPNQCGYVSLRIDGVSISGHITNQQCSNGGTYLFPVSSGSVGTHTAEFAINDSAAYPDVPEAQGRTKSICATRTFTTASADQPPDTLPNNPLTLTFTVGTASTPSPSPSPVVSPQPSPSPSPSPAPQASPTPSPSAAPAGGNNQVSLPSPTPSSSTKAQASPKASASPTAQTSLPKSGITLPSIFGIMGGALLLVLGVALAL